MIKPKNDALEMIDDIIICINKN